MIDVSLRPRRSGLEGQHDRAASIDTSSLSLTVAENFQGETISLLLVARSGSGGVAVTGPPLRASALRSKVLRA
jgi:hypothetical protein